MKISVVIPLYNKSDTVLRALNSVFSQTILPEEIIVINDGSTDGSEKVVANLNHPLVRLLNQTNKGVSAARNKGIDEARSEWVAFLDADDEWRPEFLETLKFLRTTYPQCNVLGTAYQLEDQKGNKKKIIINKMPFCGEHGILSNYFEVASCSHPPICSNSVLVYKEALKYIGGFPEGIDSGEDLLTWARLAVNCVIAYSLTPLSVYFLGLEHTYNDKPHHIPQRPDKVGQGLITLARQHKEIAEIRKYVAHWFKMRASIYIRLGMKRKSFVEALKSLFYNPLNYKVFIYFLLIPLPTGLVNRIFRIMGN